MQPACAVHLSHATCMCSTPESAHLQVGVMEGIKELAALARQDIPQRSTLGSTEGFPYPQNLLCPLQNLQTTRAPSNRWHQWSVEVPIIFPGAFFWNSIWVDTLDAGAVHRKMYLWRLQADCVQRERHLDPLPCSMAWSAVHMLVPAGP